MKSEIPEITAAKRFGLRRKMARKFLKDFRRAARHLEKTGLTREAALIKAGELYDLQLDQTQVKVVSMVGKKKTA